MHNLKKCTGTYKGLIGECLFKLTRRYVIVTKFFNKKKYFEIFKDKFSIEEKEFIDRNWFSIDALEFDYSQKPRKIILFEIKTKNKIYNPKYFWPPKMTLATHKMYNEALSKGFDVKIAIVRLLDDWNYDVEIIDFSRDNYYIDKPKKYDKI